jgi:hypothetical protein
MVNERLFASLLAVVFVFASCARKEETELSREAHHQMFLSSISNSEILDYQYYYERPRGGYITLARLKLAPNFDAAPLQRDFAETVSMPGVNGGAEIADMFSNRAASLLGGTNKVPAWFDPKYVSSVQAKAGRGGKYFEKKGPSSDQEVWWNTDQNVIYFIAIGEKSPKANIAQGKK